MNYIQRTYGVPARLGGRVIVDGRPGTIVGMRGPRIMVRFDGEDRPRLYHPTWRVEYMEAAGQPRYEGRSEAGESDPKKEE